MRSSLEISVEAIHEVLRGRLKGAFTAAVSPHRLGEYSVTEDFLASTSRHLAALSSVLVPQVRRHLGAGTERAKEFVAQSRRLELALSQINAKLYGEAHAGHRGWDTILDAASRELDHALNLERKLVHELVDALTPESLDQLALRIYHAELRSPTRPYLYAPHLGLSGRVSRSVLNHIDRFWDRTEGRIAPEPVSPHHPDSLPSEFPWVDTDPEQDSKPDPG